MNKSLLFVVQLLLINFCATFLYAQSNTFRMNYNFGMIDIPGSMIQTSDGSYLMAGTNATFIPVGNLTKLDANGDVLWAKGISAAFGTTLSDVIELSSGDYLAVGDDIVLKFLTDGTLDWARRINMPDAPSGNSSRVSTNAVVEDANGDFVLAGSVRYFYDGVNPATHDTTNCFAIKLNSSGDVLWDRTIVADVPNPDEHAYLGVTATSDGYIFVGYSSRGEGTLVNDDSDYYRFGAVYKTDFNGNEVYTRRFGSTSRSEYVRSIKLLSDGNNVITAGERGDRGFIMRLGATGSDPDPNYGHSYNTGGFVIFPEIHGYTDVMETSDGHYAVLGNYIVPLSFSFNAVSAVFNSSNGNRIRGRAYNSGMSSILPTGGLTGDDSFFMYMTAQQFTGFNYHVIKTDPTGELNNPDCPDDDYDPNRNGYTPSMNTYSYTIFENRASTSSITPAIADLTPDIVEDCRIIECTPPLEASTVEADPICAGETTTIIASGPSDPNVTYEIYENATGGSSIGSTPLDVSPTETTTYYVETVDNSDPTCVSTTRVPIEVVVNEAPPVNPTSNSPLCIGEDLELETDDVPGATYSWTGPNGFTSDVYNPTITDVTLDNDGDYEVTVTANGCTTGPITINVVVVDVPIAEPDAIETEICVGDDLELTSNTIVGADYSWTGPDGFSSTEENPVISGVTQDNAGEYELVISVGTCESEVSLVEITVNEVPEANPSSNAPICEGESIVLETDEIAGGDYSWTGPDGFTSTDQNPVISDATTISSGDYELSITANGCTSTPATINVVVEETPEALPSAVATEVCEGDDIELLANEIVGATYSWTGPEGFTSTDQNPVISNATTINSGHYELTITLGDCVSDVASISITVIDAPSINTVPNSPICEGDDLLFQTDVVTGSSYTWTGPNGFSSNEASPVIENVTTDATGTYELTVTVGTCSANQTIDVVINPTPTISYDAEDLLCNADNTGSIEINAVGEAPLTYNWDPSVSTGSNADNLEAGTYTVTVEDGNGCSATQVITINEPDALQATTSSTPSECTTPSGTATINVTGGTGSYTYDWENSIGGLFSETAENVLGGSYEVTVTDENECSITEIIEIGTIDGPQVEVQNVDHITCFGDNDGAISVSVSGGTPGYTYNWSPSQAPSITDQLTDLSPGDYSLVVIDDAGCEGAVSVTINEPARLLLDFSVNDANCGISNGSITADVNGGTGNYTYVWDPNVGTSNQLNDLAAGDYSLVVTDENGCETSGDVTVNTTGGIDMFVDPESATINYDESIDLDLYVDENIDDFEIVWSPDETLTCGDCEDPTATPGVSTTYYVTVITPDGCVATDSTVITVIPPCGELFIPDMFSPNGDNNNDLLCFYGGCPELFEISIFNRWGEVVYESNESNMCWDGTYRDKPMNTGVYAYKLRYRLQGETEETIVTGNVTLVR